MIKTEVRVKFNHLPAITAEVTPALSQVVRKTALDTETAVKLEMRKAKKGRTYRRGAIKRRATKALVGMGFKPDASGKVTVAYGFHRASAPGEAPAVDLGQLINSIRTQMETELRATVGTNVDYAPALEFGSRRAAPRPVWRPVIDKMKAPFLAAVTAVLRRLK